MYLVKDVDNQEHTMTIIDLPRHRAKKLVGKWEHLDEEIPLDEFLIYEEYADVNPDFIHTETVRNASQNH